MVRPGNGVFVVEDHGITGGLGTQLLPVLVKHGLLDGRQFDIFGVEGLPACGTPAEALAFHALDGRSLTARVVRALDPRTVC
jgi:transketolase